MSEPIKLGDDQGCVFTTAGVGKCMKVCQPGKNCCPFHVMLIAHAESVAAKKEAAKHDKKIADIRRKARR